MARPKNDGTAPREPNRRNLTELFVRKVTTDMTPINVWDQKERGLVLRVHPTGRRAFKVVYSRRGRPRWYHLGDVGLAEARTRAREIKAEVARGKDPAAERKAERGAGTFAELAERYVEQHAKRKNKSWRQADALVRKHLLPRWGKLDARSMTRSDVRTMMGRIEAPIVANQVKASASAIFSWAVKQEIVTANPCIGVDNNETRSRERVLSDSEVPRFWRAFDDAGLVRSSALKVILLTGQRPGEVSHMRREHIVDGWWEMPGAPDKELGWPGTKNGENHRVWLPEPARAVIADLDDGDTGFVFGGRRPVIGLDGAMREICAELRVNEKATPHDLRRTHGTMITRLGFGREAMNRIQNHREGGIGSVYDRHSYAEENKKVMEAVAARIMALAEGPPAGTWSTCDRRGARRSLKIWGVANQS
jgi:integrase